MHEIKRPLWANQVRITTDPEPRVCTESGVDLLGVSEVKFKLAPNEFAKADITLLSPNVNVTAHATFHMQDPRTGELKPVKTIVFADGSTYMA